MNERVYCACIGLLLAGCGGAAPPSSAPVTEAPKPEVAPEPPKPAPDAPKLEAPKPTDVANADAPSRTSSVLAALGEPQGSRVSNAPTTSSEGVSDADAVVVALRPRFRACYDAAKKTNPEIKGMVTCGVRIAKTGKVAAVGVTRRNSLPYPLVDCIVAELKKAQFAKRDEEGLIQVPVRFGDLD